ncbi:tyrosine-type recombinase/integrase [Mycobacterium intracellulare]|uniref:tyrosine-type recombinase/integrase n=1 Tax=Mycobacterium intracellulare TaxID=1767 RepID=UPI00109E69DC
MQRYEIWMQGRGLSVRTITESMYTLRRLERAAGRPAHTVAGLAISRFLSNEALGPRARYTYHVQLAGFFRWLANEDGGANTMAQIPRPRLPRSVPRPITTDQLHALLGIRMHKRTRVMILLAAFAGLRAHEIAKVRGQDVDPHARTLHVIGKGGHAATIPLHPLLVEAADTMPRHGWWFPGNSRRPGQHVLSRCVIDVVGDAMRRAEIPGGTAHRLRHWYGTNLVASGTDLRTAQTLLRHSNLASTAIYTEVTDDRRVEAIDRLALPLRSEAERAQDLLSQQTDRCKQSIVRLLGGLEPGKHMSRTKLSQALRSDVRTHINAALDELSTEGIVVTSTTERGRAYRLRPAMES